MSLRHRASGNRPNDRGQASQAQRMCGQRIRPLIGEPAVTHAFGGETRP